MLVLDLLRCPSDEILTRLDVAEVDLCCAVGLPGAERLDAGACLAWIDYAADWARRETDATLDWFAHNPTEYEGSEGVFRMLAIDGVLRRGMGVRYNEAVMADLDSPALDSRDDFIHGVIEARGGTCASLPVLYVAVGRRLGYPMRLVKTARHLFARWDDPGGERFNIEISNASGVDTPPDDHYLDWPMPIRGTPLEEVYRFRSLTPREELAMAWAKRGYCLRDNARRREAVDAFAVAWSLTPDNMLAEGSLQVAMGEWKATFPSWIEQRQRLGIEWPPRLYPGLPLELEQDIIELAVYEHRLASEPTTECWTVVKPPFLCLETPYVL